MPQPAGVLRRRLLESDKAGRDLRSLLLGYYDRGELVFAGKAGTGFGAAISRDLVERLRKIQRATFPFASAPREYQRGAPGSTRDWWPRSPSPPGPPTTCCAT